MSQDIKKAMDVNMDNATTFFIVLKKVFKIFIKVTLNLVNWTNVKINLLRFRFGLWR